MSGLNVPPKKIAITRKGKAYYIDSGDRFGVRKSSGGKEIRLILQKLGDTIVFTLSSESAKLLGKNCKPISLNKIQKESNKAEGAEKAYKDLKTLIGNNQPTDLNLGWVSWVKKLRDCFGTFEKRMRGDDFSPVIPDLLDLAKKSVPTSAKIKEGSDPKAKNIANLLVKTSVRRLVWDAVKQDDIDLCMLYLSDAADHMEAACAIYAFDGSQKSRQNILRTTSLDTDSREEFDDKVWDWIQEYAR